MKRASEAGNKFCRCFVILLLLPFSAVVWLRWDSICRGGDAGPELRWKSCLPLLASGRLSNSSSTWQPDGCSVHRYTPAEATVCFRARQALGQSNTFAFFGDSRTRYLAFGFMKCAGFQVPRTERKLKGVGDYSVECPHKQVSDSAVRYTADMLLSTHSAKPTEQEEPVPGLIVAGVAIWYMVDNFYAAGTRLAEMSFADRLDLYKTNVRTWAGDAKEFLKRHPETKILWVVQDPIGLSLPLFYNLTNDKMDLFNAAAAHTLKPYKREIALWRSARLLNVRYKQTGQEVYTRGDTVHVDDAVVHAQAQMLLNLVCNEFAREFLPEKNLCCSGSEMKVDP